MVIASLVPVAADYRAGRVGLRDLRGSTYREPFFRDTVDQSRRDRPGALDVSVDLEWLAYAAARWGGTPSGFVFHVGRCGSTLLANMLAAGGAQVVAKEPDVIIDLVAEWLRADAAPDRQEIEAAIGSAVRLLTGTLGTARGVVVKFAAWNVHIAPAVLAMFPTTQAVFIYRSPLETVASYLHTRPAWFDVIEAPRAVQARFLPSLAHVRGDSMLTETSLFAHAWRSVVEAALAVPRNRLLLVEYAELVRDPARTLRRVLRHWGQAVDEATIARMLSASSAYAKDPLGTTPFDPHGPHRRPPLDEEQTREVEATVADLWERLERERHIEG